MSFFNRFDVLGVPLDLASRQEASDKILDLISSGNGRKFMVTTVNPEYVLGALSNDKFKNYLKISDLNVVDGYGLVTAINYLNQVRSQQNVMLRHIISPVLFLSYFCFPFLIPKSYNILSERVTGVDMTMDLLKELNNTGGSVYLVGTAYQSGEESASKTKTALLKLFPNLNIIGACSGREPLSDGNYGYVDFNVVQKTIKDDLKKHNLELADLMLVAFGQARQELWVHEHLNELPAKVFIGVGATFDFISGRQKRAPLFVQNLRLEWLFRLLTNFSMERMLRVFKAVVVFPFKVFLSSF